MPNDLTTAMGRLIAQASKTLPATTGETETYRRRQANASGATVILCDLSGSMSESAGGKRKIDQLRDALAEVQHNLNIRLIGFNSHAFQIPSAVELPAPSGGTAMHLGLEAAAHHRPSKTLVISDGLPDSEESALAVAERITGIIDVIYCGPDDDAKAIAFMRRLARAGAGRVVVHDLRRAGRPALASAVRQVLALPAPKGRP